MIAYILMSWIPELRRSKFYGFVSSVTDPYLRIFRGLIVIGMMDLTPIIGLMLYQFGLSALGQVINSL
jgi:YggT family protein